MATAGNTQAVGSQIWLHITIFLRVEIFKNTDFLNLMPTDCFSSLEVGPKLLFFPPQAVRD